MPWIVQSAQIHTLGTGILIKKVNVDQSVVHLDHLMTNKIYMFKTYLNVLVIFDLLASRYNGI